jgi:hypothetical protein
VSSSFLFVSISPVHEKAILRQLIPCSSCIIPISRPLSTSQVRKRYALRKIDPTQVECDMLPRKQCRAQLLSCTLWTGEIDLNARCRMQGQRFSWASSANWFYWHGGPASVRKVPLSENQPLAPIEGAPKNQEKKANSCRW